MNLCKCFLISIVIFAFYIEFSPGLGNIWYRVNSLGYKVIRIDYFISYLIEPLRNPILWNYKLWDSNSIIFISIMTLLIYYLFKTKHQIKTIHQKRR